MITAVVRHYYPAWNPPVDDGRKWVPCLCPAHEETRPSAAVSFQLDSIACLACGFKGNAVSIVARKEGMRYQAAIKRAAEIADRDHKEVSRQLSRKPGRRLFGEPRTAGGQDRQVPVWLRR